MYGKRIFILSLILLIILLSLPACTSNQTNDERVVDAHPATEEPDKVNPNLDGNLNQLIRAEERGEAEEFAKSSDIELIDDGVKVIIHCLPDQIEVAVESVINVGANQVKSRDNLIQAVVPITSLNSLAEAPGISFIRLPVYAEQE